LLIVLANKIFRPGSFPAGVLEGLLEAIYGKIGGGKVDRSKLGTRVLDLASLIATWQRDRCRPQRSSVSYGPAGTRPRGQGGDVGHPDRVRVSG